MLWDLVSLETTLKPFGRWWTGTGQGHLKVVWSEDGVCEGGQRREKQQLLGRPQRSGPNRNGPSSHREGRSGWGGAGTPADAPGDGGVSICPVKVTRTHNSVLSRRMPLLGLFLR